MNISEKFESEFQKIESSIIDVYRSNPELSDIQVERAIETAINIQNSKLKGRKVIPHKLSSLDLIVFENVELVTQNLVENRIEFSNVELLQCLKFIRKSVQRWNKKNGKQGYLNFVNQYV